MVQPLRVRGDLAMPYKSGGPTQLFLLLGADQGQRPELFLKGPAGKYLRLRGPTVVVAPAQPSPRKKDAAA